MLPSRSRIASMCVVAVLTGGCALSRVAPRATAPAGADRRNSASAPANGTSARQGSSGTLSQTLESYDERLSASLLKAAVLPSASTYMAAAIQYRRLGVLDKAFEYFERAAVLDPTDAKAHEGMARIWRDWGTSALGLRPAYLAVHYAPQSGPIANTLGTVLQAMGRLDEAEHWYRKALALDRTGWYALNNICYVQIMRRNAAALETCGAAVRAAGPNVAAPRNNLALAYAAAGDLPGARQWFRRANDPVRANYNYGITLMATGNYTRALTAFQAALDAEPQSSMIAARVHQARLAAVGEERSR